jgi:hypothetical protein
MRKVHAPEIIPPLPQVLGDGSHLGVCVRLYLQVKRGVLMKTIQAIDLFCGTKSEKIKQIGNAVPVKTVEALCGALLQ